MLNWFNTIEIEGFAKWLAEDLFQHYPPMDIESRDKKAEQRLLAVKDMLIASTLKFKTEHKLNLYKKAKLGNVFKWELQALGYKTELIEYFTESVIICLAAKVRNKF